MTGQEVGKDDMKEVSKGVNDTGVNFNITKCLARCLSEPYQESLATFQGFFRRL